MNSKTIQEVLLIETHRAIRSAAVAAVAKIGNAQLPVPGLGAGILQAGAIISYPPADAVNRGLSEAEVEAVAKVELTADARSALTKIVADAAASAFSEVFCLLDGVADPQVQRVEEWYGATLDERGETNDQMLHDAFFESYWKYRALVGERT
jgi:hypothetical protein